MGNNYELQWRIKSPNGRIVLEVTLNEARELCYSVLKDDVTMLDKSPLGIITNIADFSKDISFVDADIININESYSPIAGKMASYVNHCNELKLRFKKHAGEFDLVIRAYDDGIAYRYYIPGNGPIEVVSELSGFKLPNDDLVNVWAQEFHPSYENTYDFNMLEDLRAEHYGMPMLFQVGRKGWLLISEAAVYGNYCASNIKGISEDKRTLMLSFAPDQQRPIKSTCPFATPWRVIIIGDNLNSIVRSSILENLNPPSELEDTSWIKPGRASWPWFTDKSSCSNLETNKKFVDFTASMGWEYLLVDAGWEGKLPVEELVRYADKKGIGIWIWAHSKDFHNEAYVREKFSLWSGWGIKGVKIDFFESDSQEMIAVYDTIAQVAAEYNLMVNYHGCTKPSGEQRRWPHIMTREGVLGAEYLGHEWSWSELHPLGPTAEHNCTLPFTRNVIGPMDYTPVVFLRSNKRTTYAHQIALSVVFESHVQHFADSKEAYIQCIGKEFLKAVPSTWDDTVLLEGYPGRYVTMARRKGDDWFIGAICAVNGRKATIRLDFLDACNYTATIYEDGPNWDSIKRLNANEIYKRTINVTKGDVLEIPLKKNGGCAIHLTKQDG